MKFISKLISALWGVRNQSDTTMPTKPAIVPDDATWLLCNYKWCPMREAESITVSLVSREADNGGTV